MKFTFRLFACTILAAAMGIPIFAQESQSLLLLKEEILRADKQRDAARRKLLELEARNEPEVQKMNEERAALNAEMDTLKRRIQENQAGSTAANAALQRAEHELRVREAKEELLRNQLRADQSAFAKLLNQMRDDSLRQEATSVDAQRESEAQRKTLETKQEELVRDMEARENQLKASESAREDLAKERDQFRDLNENLNSEISAARRAEALANAKVSALENRMTHLQQELERQYEERSLLEQERDRLRGEVESLTLRLTELQSSSVPRAEAEAAQKALDEARLELEALRNDSDLPASQVDLTKDLLRARRERDLLDARRKTLESKLAEAEDKFKEERDQGRALARDNKRLQKEVSSGDSARKALEKQLEALRKDLEAARAAGVRGEELDAVKSVLAGMEEERRQWQETLDQQKGSVDVLTQQLNEEQTSGRTQLLELQSALGERLRELAQSHIQVEQLTLRAARVPGLEAERQQLVLRRDKSQQDMRTLALHIHELRGQISEGRRLKTELDQSRSEALTLQRDLEGARDQAEALRQTKSAMEAEMAELQRRLRRLEAQND